MITPLHDRIVVKPDPKETESLGGVVIPDTVKEPPMKGLVISTGPGFRDEDGTIHPLVVKSGDHIMFSKYAGIETVIENETYLIMREEDVVAILAD